MPRATRGHEGDRRSGLATEKEVVVVVERAAVVTQVAYPLDKHSGVAEGIPLNRMVMELDEDLTERSEIVAANVPQEFILGAFDVQFQDVDGIPDRMIGQRSTMGKVTQE